MFASRKAKRASLVAVLALVFPALTACDPPMPPELLAQIAEQSVSCESGEAAFAFDENLREVFNGWAESVAQACTEPAMAFTEDQTAAQDGIVLSAAPVAPCEPTLQVPLAYDAGVLAFSLSDASTVVMSPKTIGAVLNSQITTWSDSEIAAENPDLVLPDMPITLRQQVDASALQAIKNLLQQNNVVFDAQKFVPETQTDANQIEPLAEGELALLPASVAIPLGLSSVGIDSQKTDADGYQVVALADADGIYSASTQLVATKTENSVTSKLDSTIEPKSFFEGEAAAPPYQAIYPVNLYICGPESLLKHAAATFILRLDSQGSLTNFNLGQVPESIRIEALALARKGLPEPTLKSEPETN